VAVIETKPFCSAINCSFSDAFGPMAAEKPSPVRTRRKTHKGRSLHAPILTGLSGILPTWILLGRTPRFVGVPSNACSATLSAFCEYFAQCALSLRLRFQIRDNFVSGDCPAAPHLREGDCRLIAEQASKEANPAKLMILIGKRCCALEAERREKPRMIVTQWERVSVFLGN